MLIRDSNFRPFLSSFLGNKIDVKANIFYSITCNLSSIHDIYKAWFSIRNSAKVNFRSHLNFVHLAKNYGTLRFKDSIQW